MAMFSNSGSVTRMMSRRGPLDSFGLYSNRFTTLRSASMALCTLGKARGTVAGGGGDWGGGRLGVGAPKRSRWCGVWTREMTDSQRQGMEHQTVVRPCSAQITTGRVAQTRILCYTQSVYITHYKAPPSTRTSAMLSYKRSRPFITYRKTSPVCSWATTAGIRSGHSSGKS